MDLKIKDLAELLSVSEATIRRWLAKGRIPAYKLNHQYRFNRTEIESWMMSCKVKPAEEEIFPLNEEQIYPIPEDSSVVDSRSSNGLQQYSLYRSLHKGEVFFDIEGETKEEVIRKTMQLAAPKLGLDHEVLSELLLDREKMMSTALNNGIAIPHARDFLLPTPSDTVFIVYLQKPLEYGALDGKPVHTLFFLFSSTDKKHLHLLAKIAHFCSQPELFQFLCQKPAKELLLPFIKEWEEKIGG